MTSPLPPSEDSAQAARDSRVSLTVATNRNGLLTKQFSLDPNGALVRRPAPPLADGTFETVSLPFHELASRLNTLRADQALIWGVDKDGRRSGRIVTEDVARVTTDPDTIARTKAQFAWPLGAGVLALDVDLKDALPNLAQLPDDPTIEQLRQVFISAIPQLANVPMIAWPSASACLRREATGEHLSGMTGARFYLPVARANEIPALGLLLHERLLLAGFGFAFISRAGTIQVRSVIDRSVWSPERLDFAAGASCDAGIAQERGSPRCWHHDRAMFLTRETLHSLSQSERQRLASVQAEIVKAAQPRATKVREEYVERQRAAGRTVSMKWSENGEIEWLNDDHDVTLDNGTVVTIGEIVADPNRFHGRNCADPEDPDYGDDHRIARIYTIGQTSGPAINSFAHGGRTYRFGATTGEEFGVDSGTTAGAVAVVPLDDHLTDMGNAGRFARAYHDQLVFVNDEWRKWDGRRWAQANDVELQELAKKIVRQMFNEANGLGDKTDRKDLAKWAFRSESLPRIRAMIELARDALVLSGEQLDADPFLLNVENGTIDLRTRELRPHSPSDYITKRAPVTYDSSAPCPLWLAFLDRIFGKDKELIEALQRVVGYALTGSTEEQVLFFFYGTGANGKSTLLEVLRDLFGEYATAADFSALLKHKGGSAGGARSDLVRLRGARLVTASEVPPGQEFDEAVVKSFTGGDTISARPLYHEPIEFRPQCKFILRANNRPHVRGDDPAMWRRILTFPFDVSIPDAEKDTELPDKLRAELPGILAWTVRGCAAWMERGLQMPRAVLDATADYRAEMSSVAAFIQARCELASGVQVTKAELHEAYAQWCERIGTSHPLAIREFNKQVSRHDPGSIATGKSSVAVWKGLRLLPVAAPDSDDGPADIAPDEAALRALIA